jgi:hypothetical protein
MLGAAKVNEFCSKPFSQANFSATLPMMTGFTCRPHEVQQVMMPVLQNVEYRTGNIEYRREVEMLK